MNLHNDDDNVNDGDIHVINIMLWIGKWWVTSKTSPTILKLSIHINLIEHHYIFGFSGFSLSTAISHNIHLADLRIFVIHIQ